MDFSADEVRNASQYLLGVKAAKVEFHDYLFNTKSIIPHVNSDETDDIYPYAYKVSVFSCFSMFSCHVYF